MSNLDTWTPLFSSIVASSIWGQKPYIRVVWITMLAVKGRDGFVAGSVPGLARLAAVSIEECKEALAMFESPDPDSKSSEFEGVKIKSVDGGWKILSHERFQALMKEVSGKISNAKRQKAHRDRKKSVGSTTVERAAIAAEDRGDTDTADRMINGTLPEPVPLSLEERLARAREVAARQEAAKTSLESPPSSASVPL